MWVAYPSPKQSNFVDELSSLLEILTSDCGWYILSDMNICTLHKAGSMYHAYSKILTNLN